MVSSQAHCSHVVYRFYMLGQIKTVLSLENKQAWKENRILKQLGIPNRIAGSCPDEPVERPIGWQVPAM